MKNIIKEMRRLTRSPNYLLPICFRELSAAAFQKLFTDCCSQRRIPSLRNFDSLNFNCVNKDLPHILGKLRRRFPTNRDGLDKKIYCTGGDHKIKHFACHRDFFVHKIPRIKHTQNAPYPGIKHFSSYSILRH